MTTYPLTPEGAEQFLPQVERIKAAKKYQRRIRDLRRRLDLANEAADTARRFWLAGLGNFADLYESERLAWKAQWIAHELWGNEERHRKHLASMTTQNVSRAVPPQIQDIPEGKAAS